MSTIQYYDFIRIKAYSYQNRHDPSILHWVKSRKLPGENKYVQP